MRVFVDVVPGSLSRAMHRVAKALRTYAPPEVKVVDRVQEAELQVLHVIGITGMQRAIRAAPSYAIIQYCYASAGGSVQEWRGIWEGAKLTWSYYALPSTQQARVLRQPLGVDGDVFVPGAAERTVGVVSSGYVAGPGAEAIEEVAEAALRNKLSVTHLGPGSVVGMVPRREPTWRAVQNLSDAKLAELYGSARWVSGLRRTEGFELPVVEGLACGARPVVFDREETRFWFDGIATFVPELGRVHLTERLYSAFAQEPIPVTAEERELVLNRFNWERISRRFWAEVLG